jgi:hypothetical protein
VAICSITSELVDKERLLLEYELAEKEEKLMEWQQKYHQLERRVEQVRVPP